MTGKDDLERKESKKYTIMSHSDPNRIHLRISQKVKYKNLPIQFDSNTG
jgi:hypothetical protein